MALGKKKEERESTFYWKRYERGMGYVHKKQLIPETNMNWNFYIGNQWVDIQAGDEQLPMMPFISGVVDYKVTTITQNTMIAKFSDMENRPELDHVYKKFDALFLENWEKACEERESRTTVRAGNVAGESYQYFGYADMGKMEHLPCTNVLLGDESQYRIQKQPYVMIWDRRSVKEVREEARMNGVDEEEIALILPDSETQDVVGNRDELDETQDVNDSKVTVIYHFEKKAGVVHVAKTTRHVVYEPEHPIAVTNPDGSQGRGLSLYPILKFGWKYMPNNARGISDVKYLIPNQIEVNKTLARRSQIIKMTAFPRLAYDSSAIQNPEALMEVGMPIEISGGSAQSVNQMISYLNPAQSNNDAKNYADDLLQMTQELAGAGETARGNIELSRVAASALLAVKDQSAQSLSDAQAEYKQFVEDFAHLSTEFAIVYNPNGIEVTVDVNDPATGTIIPQKQVITPDEMEMVKPKIRIDVSNDSPWTKEAEQNCVDQLLLNQQINLEEYMKLAPDNGIVPKGKLEEIIRDRKIQEQIMMQQQQMMAQAQEQMLIEQGDAEDKYEEEAKQLQ